MTGHCGETSQLAFAAGLFDIEALKRAAYRLSAELVVEFDPTPDHITCTLRTLKPNADIRELENQFRQEVLDYDLRIRIAKETEPLRNLVLSLAFSKTGLPE